MCLVCIKFSLTGLEKRRRCNDSKKLFRLVCICFFIPITHTLGFKGFERIGSFFGFGKFTLKFIDYIKNKLSGRWFNALNTIFIYGADPRKTYRSTFYEGIYGSSNIMIRKMKRQELLYLNSIIRRMKSKAIVTVQSLKWWKVYVSENLDNAFP